jgi:ribosome-associated toxin RatA of RatAB toxin-antitoxin module
MRKQVIVPVALGAAGALASGKGQDLVRNLADSLDGTRQQAEEKVGEKVLEVAKERLESDGSIVGKMVAKKLDKPGGGGSGGKTRRLPIQRWTDVAVPVELAYKAFTDFDSYPKFMHRVERVEKTGRNKVRFEEKIWFARRQWEAQITERRANDRIVWKTTSGISHRGIVSFHKLDPKLTRVMVDMEFEPSGVIEKMASGLRFVKRAVQADLARFKAHVEMSDAKGIEYRSGGEGKAKADSDNGDADNDDADEPPTRSKRSSAKKTAS